MKQLTVIYTLAILLLSIPSAAQIPDHIYSPDIKTVKFSVYGNQLAYPVWTLNSSDKLELDFDDLSGSVKNYSYTFDLYNADWSPAMLSQFDYISGFSQMRITNYRVSSVAFTRYVHYQAVLPDRSCMPTHSGNYLLKIFLDGDTSKVAFTRRLLVVAQKASVGAQILQPFNGQYFRSHQKIQLTVNTQALSVMNPMQQVHVCILQNNRWDITCTISDPHSSARTRLNTMRKMTSCFPGAANGAGSTCAASGCRATGWKKLIIPTSLQPYM